MIKATIAIIDLVIVFILSFFIFRGFKNGLVTELVRIIGTYAGLVVAVKYMSDLAIKIHDAINLPPTLVLIISFMVIFTPIVLIFKFLASKFLEAIKFSVSLGLLDKIGGVALGLLKGAIVVSLLTVVLSFATFSPELQKEIEQSVLFEPMKQVLPMVYEAIKVILSDSKPLADELKEGFSGFGMDSSVEVQDLINSYEK